MIPF
jgi:hypothetical protein